MPIRRRELLLLAVALLAALALLEIGAAVVRLTLLGPQAPRTSTTAASEADEDVFEDRYVAGMALHPYLGFAADPDEPRVNAYGFFGSDPLAKAAPEELVVGLFGGSLASALAHRGGLAGTLSELAFPGRAIRIVDLGMGGYKQPQQLLLLSYLLAVGARFDIVINLDGFNEVALPFAENARHGVNPFYPRSWNLYAQRGFDRELALQVGEVERLARQRERWADRLAGPLGASQVAKLVGALADRRLYNAWYQANEALAERLAGDDASATGPPLRFETPDAFFAELALVWSRSSIQMANLCRGSGIAYFHFLQPNQYVEGSKPMSELERETALARGNFPFATAVREGYPHLVRAGGSLGSAGVRFTDLTDVFRGETRPLYTDRCCHVNDLGYQLMATAMVQAIAELPGLTPER